MGQGLQLCLFLMSQKGNSLKGPELKDQKMGNISQGRWSTHADKTLP